MFDVPYEDVPKYDEDENGEKTIRYYGKRSRHGLPYRMMPKTFSERNKIPLSKAQIIYQWIHKEYPEIKQWWNRLTREVKLSKEEKGYGILYNVFGRRLCFLEAITENTLESIVAFRPQSSIGDMLQRAWYLCHEDKEWPHEQAKILINVHDSLTALAHHSVSDLVLRIMVRHAESPIVVNGQSLIIPAEAKVSYPDEHRIHRWSNLKGVNVNTVSS